MQQRLRFWNISVIVIVIAALFVSGLGLLGLLPWQSGQASGNLYQDPQGRFTMTLGTGWEQVQTDGSYVQFKEQDPPYLFNMLVLKASTIDDAFSKALQAFGLDPALLNRGGRAQLGDWQAVNIVDTTGRNNGLAGQIQGEDAYVAVVQAGKPGLEVETPPVVQALQSIKIIGKQKNEIKSFTELEALVRQQVDSLAGSISVAVVHKDQIVYTYAYGQANPLKGVAADTRTIYQFGSMTKPITATALMQLEEQDKVDLDAWPGKYVPEFPKQWNVTVRQLLDHSACMRDDQSLANGLIVKPGQSFAPLAEIFTKYVKDYPDLGCEPGKASNYSNPHFLALSRIVEEVSGEDFESYVVKHILTPLAMESTSFQTVSSNEGRYAKPQLPVAQADELAAQINKFHGPGLEDLVLGKDKSYATIENVRILPPWGGLRGTPSDLTHFLQMFLNGGRYGDNQILKPQTVAFMQKMQTSTDGSPLGLGLSWWIDKDGYGTYYYHNGGAPGTEDKMRYYPSLDLGVVVMANLEGYQSATIAAGLVSAWASGAK